MLISYWAVLESSDKFHSIEMNNSSMLLKLTSVFGGFLHVCSSRILVCSFLSFSCMLLVLTIRIMLCKIYFEKYSFHSFFLKYLFAFCFVKFERRVLGFSLMRTFIFYYWFNIITLLLISSIFFFIVLCWWCVFFPKFTHFCKIINLVKNTCLQFPLSYFCQLTLILFLTLFDSSLFELILLRASHFFFCFVKN